MPRSIPHPCRQHCPSGDNGPGIAAIVGLIIGGGALISGAAAAWRWLFEPHAVLEAVLYSAIGLVVLGSVALVAVVLRRDGHGIVLHYDPAAARQAAAERRDATATATAQVSVSVQTSAPVIAPQYHQHLHFHGGRARREAQQLEARQQARAEALEWALEQIAQRDAIAGRPNLPVPIDLHNGPETVPAASVIPGRVLSRREAR